MNLQINNDLMHINDIENIYYSSSESKSEYNDINLKLKKKNNSIEN